MTMIATTEPRTTGAPAELYHNLVCVADRNYRGDHVEYRTVFLNPAHVVTIRGLDRGGSSIVLVSESLVVDDDPERIAHLLCQARDPMRRI